MMIKTMLKGIGITFLFLVIIFVLIFAWSSVKSSQYEETAIPYMNTAIEDISKWNVESFKQYLTPSIIKDINEQDLKTLIKGLSKMGGLVEIGEYEFNNVTSRAVTSGGSGTFVTYVVPAKYENGDANLTITLKEEGDSFSVYHFKLNSLTLLE
jgi:Na+-transporting methylmalonyl-CoA/oxaloacetate decarboxylase gamma subunit